MKLPEIRMTHGSHLDRAFKEYISEIPKDFKIDSRENILEKITLYKKEWAKYEQKFLQGMCDILGLEFYCKVIDAYIVGTYKKAFSNPLVISSKCTPDIFVDILTHEILHILLIDNTKNVPSTEIWKELFPEAIDMTSLNHILVHAVHKEIYLNIMNAPERLEADIERCNNWSKGYQDAWNIVEKRGHMKIINEFKNYYLDK